MCYWVFDGYLRVRNPTGGGQPKLISHRYREIEHPEPRILDGTSGHGVALMAHVWDFGGSKTNPTRYGLQLKPRRRGV